MLCLRKTDSNVLYPVNWLERTNREQQILPPIHPIDIGWSEEELDIPEYESFFPSGPDSSPAGREGRRAQSSPYERVAYTHHKPLQFLAELVSYGLLIAILLAAGAVYAL